MDIMKQHIPAKTYIGKTAIVKISKLVGNPIFDEVYPTVGSYLQETGQNVRGWVVIYKEWYPQKDETVMMPAYEVDTNIIPGDFEVFRVEDRDAYVTEHQGAYNKLKETHQKIQVYLQEHAIKSDFVVEQYITGPAEGVPEEDLVTRIIYYI